MAEVDQLCVELELTPKVKMMEFIALPQVCAMGVVEYLHGLGTVSYTHLTLPTNSRV